MQIAKNEEYYNRYSISFQSFIFYFSYNNYYTSVMLQEPQILWSSAQHINSLHTLQNEDQSSLLFLHHQMVTCKI